MNRLIRIVAIFICILMCALGAIFSPNEKADVLESKNAVVPITNQQPHRRAWILI
jgi:hypothetical protein